jgi:hypothetical protein
MHGMRQLRHGLRLAGLHDAGKSLVMRDFPAHGYRRGLQPQGLFSVQGQPGPEHDRVMGG